MLNEPILKKKNIINRILNNQILITCFTSILMVIVIVGSSYALFNKEAVLNNDVIVKSGSLEVVISNTTERIELDYTTLGVEDEVGLTYNPYSFSIENTGENDILYYEVRIVDKEHEISTLPHKSLNFSIQKDSGGYSSPVNLGDNGSYIAGDFNLSVGEKHLYDLKLWINTEFGEYANNKILNASIEVILYSELPLKNNIIYDSNGGSFVAKTNINTNKISSVVPSMEGYDFGGWATSPDSKVVEYKKGEEIDLSKGVILYAVWKARNVMDIFTPTIKNQASNVTKIFFIDETTEEIDKRYASATIKDDLTYNNQGRVLGWLETDPDDNTKYYLYVGSDGTTYLRTGNNLFSNPSNTSLRFKAVNSIEFNNINTSLVTSMANMFESCGKLISLDLSKFDTSNVTNMSRMFSGCSSLVDFDVNNLNVENVTDMSYMFNYCGGNINIKIENWKTINCEKMNYMFCNSNFSLIELNLSNTEKVMDMSNMFSSTYAETIVINSFDTQNVINMSNMFSNCSKLKNIELKILNSNKVTNMSKMFYNCELLVDLDLSSLNTISVTNMSQMFACTGTSDMQLTNLNISNFDTRNVTNMSSMFWNCYLLKTIDVGNWNTSNVTNMSGIFSGCYGLESLDLSKWNTSNVTTMSSMFYGCKSLTTLDLNSFVTNNVTSMYQMFRECSSLSTIDLSSFVTNNVTNMSHMFQSCRFTTIDLSSFTTTNVTDISYIFSTCRNLTSIDLSLLDTTNVTSMAGMFRSCSSLTSLNLSPLVTDNVTSMASIFEGCSELTYLDLTPLVTNNVTNMSRMFAGCSKLTSIDLSPLVTDNVTNMSYMFSECSKLASLDLNSFSTDNVTDMTRMFFKCSSLISLDLSNFDTASLTNIGSYVSYESSHTGMFYGCTKLVELDISSFDFSKITTYNGAFTKMPAGATIYVKDEYAQTTILGINASYRPAWTTSNVIVKSTT